MMVVFCTHCKGPDSNVAQTNFMIEGFSAIESELRKLNIGSIVLEQEPDKCLPKLLHQIDAKLLICDFNPLKSHRTQQDQLTKKIKIPYYKVDSHNIVPAWVVSEKKNNSLHKPPNLSLKNCQDQERIKALSRRGTTGDGEEKPYLVTFTVDKALMLVGGEEKPL